MPPRSSNRGIGSQKTNHRTIPACWLPCSAQRGPRAGLLPGYEHREPQLQMLLGVAQIQARGGTLTVEAGTGTGKSLAYLGPSIARAVRHHERVLVSTNTHTLQEQLMGKDLPG